MDKPVKKTVRQMLLIVVGMFGFGFALVPLYDVFCDITGLNGKTSDTAYEAVDVVVDTSRTVKIQFVATNNENMPWEFKPTVSSMNVHPGEVASTEFFARNPRSVAMIAQAVPSLVPFKAAEYFHKTECFCFNQQPLAADASAELPLIFYVDADLPASINTLTLSYTLYDITDKQAVSAKQGAAR